MANSRKKRRIYAQISRNTNKVLGKVRQHLGKEDALLSMSLLGVFAGAIAALVILAFRWAIDWPLENLLPGGNSENFEGLSKEMRFLLPATGAIIIGFLLGLSKRRYHSTGLAHVVHIMNNRHGKFPFKNAIVQFVAGSLAILTGQSGGREGPAVHLGAAVNSWAAQYFHLPNNSSRILISCGTAAAIAASFNTPIAGVIFAMEVVMLEYTIMGFTPVILAAITGALLTRASFGNEPEFIINAFQMSSFQEVFFVALIGLACGSAAALFVSIQKYCLRWSHLIPVIRFGIAGLITGTAGVFVPQVLGLGYDTLQTLLVTDMAATLLVAIVIAKLVVTAISCGLGVPLGYVGPALIIGAGVGSLLGSAGISTNPEQASELTLYVLLGMGAFMGAMLNAPLAALMAVVELTNSSHIILPAMLAIISATLTSTGLFRQQSAVQATLASQGFKINNDPLSQALQRAAVTSIMDQNFRRVSHKIGVADIQRLLQNRPRWILIKLPENEKRLLDSSDLVLFMQEYSQADEESVQNRTENQSISLLEISGRQRVVVDLHPQATLREALETLDEKKADALHITAPVLALYVPPSGIITREDIENYYRYPQGSF